MTQILKKKNKKTVRLGEYDEAGKLKVPHTYYGIIKNMGFIFRKIWQYKKIIVLLFMLGAVTQSVMRYLWSFIAKYVIDIVQAQADMVTKDLSPLFKLLLITTLIELISVGSNTIIQN